MRRLRKTYVSRIARRPVRVLHFVGRMTPGGAENWLMKLLHKADRDALQMDFCVTSLEKGLYEKEIEFLGSRIIRCPLSPSLTYQRRLAQILRANPYDVVHSHIWLFSGIILRVAHQVNVPVRIAYSHNTRDKYSRTLYRRLYARLMKRLIMKHATHCLGCSSEAAAALFGKGWRNVDKCRLLYTCIDVEEFHPGQMPSINKTDFGLPSDAVVIGHVGNFRRQKNHVFVLDTAAEVIKREKRAFFFLVGDGELRREAEAKARRLGISNRVIFGGVRDDVPQLMMNLFDVFLFPSLYEGMPLTLVEAAAAGLRVVCSDVITNDATDVLPEAFTRLSLRLGPAQWAAAVIEAVNKGRVSHDTAYNQVKSSHFSDEFCLKVLERLYSARTPQPDSS